jgi:hypothetical protein
MNADRFRVAGRRSALTLGLLAGLFGRALAQGADGAVAGRITDPDGGPAAGVRVEAEGGWRAAVSDAEGRYLLTGLAAGDVTLRYAEPGGAGGSLPPMRICPGVTVPGDFRLPRPGEASVELIEWRVTDRCGENAPGSARVIGRDEADLAADRLADLLALEPGVSSLDEGDLSIHGAGRNALGAYLDGVPVTPGARAFTTPLLGGSWFGERGSGAALGTNGYENVTLVSGPGSAEFGDARGGIIGVASRNPGSVTRDAPEPAVRVRTGWATDAIFGRKNGLDFNRVTVDGQGRFGRLAVGIAGVLEGQGTARLGLEQNQSPVYLSHGVDTSVTFATPGGSQTVDVFRFAPSEGVRIPASANSSYFLLGRADYAVARGHRLQLSALASQDQAREFDYASLYNPQQLRADRSWSRVLTGSWLGSLRQSEGLQLSGEAHLSWQTDRSTTGPLTPSSESDSRDPFGGLLIAPLGFRFDAGNFPVNDELIRNFRTNSGRLSPYDLNNPTQYSLIDAYRNNAYGLTGFWDGGGPTGLLRLSREDRLVFKGVVDARLGARHHLRAGAEEVQYDIDFYSSQLTSQAFADAWRESPSRLGLFADYELRVAQLVVAGGLRYDRFHSNASRPDFPRISTAPGFDPARPTAGFTADGAHSRVSPRLRATFFPSPRLSVSGAVGAVAALPDFNALYSGINTDLSVTNPAQPYGSDLDFEHATLGELGARYALDDHSFVEGTLWTRSDEDLVVLRLHPEFDPVTLSTADIRRYDNAGSSKATGVDLRVAHRLGTRGRAWIGYGYVDANQRPNGGSSIPRSDVRPHTVVGAVLYQTGPDNRALAGLLRNTGVYGAVRVASGTRYTRCDPLNPADIGTLSDQGCAGLPAGDLNGASLPALKLVDLRLTRTFRLGGADLVVFGDARNLFNTRNTIRVFGQTGKVSNARERALQRQADLSLFASEAFRNGVRLSDGTVDLSFGGATDPRAACGAWMRDDGTPAPPNCIYLLQAEQRFGDGDHLFSPQEQTRASDALYDVARGLQYFTGPGRRVRVGAELRF